MVLRFFSRLFLILLLGLISACGFHLRGDTSISSRLNPIYLESGQLDPQQLNLIKNALKRAKADLQTEQDSSNRLWVKLGQLKTQKIAGSSLSDVELLRASMRLEFTIKNAANEILLSDEITQSRELQLNTDNVLSNQQLIDRAHNDLQRSLIRVMIFQLNHF